MLLPYSARLRSSGVRIVLASTSPRRRELMALLLPYGGAAAGGVPFTCVPSSFAEDLPHSAHESAASYALATCAAKAEEVWARVAADTDVLIAADTVVVRDGVILEKPQCQSRALSYCALLIRAALVGCSGARQLQCNAVMFAHSFFLRYALSSFMYLSSSIRARFHHAPLAERSHAPGGDGRDAAVPR